MVSQCLNQPTGRNLQRIAGIGHIKNNTGLYTQFTLSSYVQITLTALVFPNPKSIIHIGSSEKKIPKMT